VNFGFVPFTRAAQFITEEEHPRAREKLGKFLQDNLECAEEVLCQYQGRVLKVQQKEEVMVSSWE